ncbi:MAG: hypothetical protein ABIX01_13615 [Chitinophagaceae bacterium]
MKKIIGSFALLGFFILQACTNQPAEVKKEIIVVPAAPVKEQPVIIVKEPPVKQQPVVIVKEPAEKATTISLDKNGVKVATKKVDIQLKKQ